MTTCRDVKDLLPGYVDARLALDETAIVRAHLDACGACGRERAALEKTDALLEAALSDHPWGDEGLEALVAGVRARAKKQAAAPAPGAKAPEQRRFGGGGGGVWVAAAAVLLVGVALTLRQPPPASPTTTPAPRALAVAGEHLLRAGPEGYAPLAAGAEVLAGDVLVAAAPGAHLRLDDGTRVEMFGDTEVTLRDDADGGVTVAMGGMGGEVYCEVSKRSRPFRVAARGLDVEVLGTRFLVNHGVRLSRVVVLEGRVLASTRGDRRTLSADDSAEAHEGEQALRTGRVSAPTYGLWVPRVARELEDRFPATAPSAPEPAPAEPPPLAPTPPAPPTPDLDTPVVPPGGR